jgi:Concanavalin A-like lectin/glucanases superfamily
MSLFSATGFYSNSNTGSYVQDGLIGYWDASIYSSYPGTGQPWYDLSPYKNDLSISGLPPFNPGEISYFQVGLGDYMVNGSQQLANLSLDNNAMSWFVGVNVHTFPSSSSGVIFSNFIASRGAYRFAARNFGGTTGSRFFWQAWDENNNATEQFASASYNQTGSWYVIGGTFEWSGSGPATTYVNGGPGFTTNYGTFTRPVTDTANGFQLCRAIGVGNHFSGSISFVMIYNKKLSATEITQNFDYFSSSFGY